MSVPVKFYFFGKDPDSTERPAGAPVATYDCIMLEDTSVLHPALRLQIDDADVAAVIACNYARIDLFDRFYFVTWTASGPFWIAALDNDPLASWRGSIGALTQYVVRAESQYDETIIDTQYPTRSDPTILDAVPDPDNPKFEWQLNKGSFIMGIINKDGAGTAGAVSYYVFDSVDIRGFFAQMMGTIDYAYAGITEVSQQLFKGLYNPMEYIVSCQWFPFDIPEGEPISSVDLGHYVLNTPARRLIPPLVKRKRFVFNLSEHPQAHNGRAYLNQAPYTTTRISWAPLGSFDLDPTLVIPGPLTMALEIDLITGSATVEFIQSKGQILQTTCQIGVSALLSNQTRHDWGTIASGMAGAVGGALTLQPGAIFEGLANATNGMVAHNSTSGSNGNAAKYWFAPLVQRIFFRITSTAEDSLGRPLCKNVQIDSLRGYVQIPTPEIVGLEATPEELAEIAAHFREGFRYV